MATIDVYTSLTLSHPDLDPGEISTRLDLIPTSGHQRGERYGIDREWQSGFWSFSTEFMESKDFGEHLEALMDAITPRAELIRELVGEGIEAEVFGYLSTDDGQVSIDLSPNQIDFLHSIGVRFAFLAN